MNPDIDLLDSTRDAEAPKPRRRLARLRPSELDLRNAGQIVVGVLLIPLGIAFIILAWYGAAHGRVDQQQLPYLVSGGIGGLATVLVGCFFYWAHWLYRIYDQADLHHQEAMRQQRELFRSLVETVAAGQIAKPVPADFTGGETTPVASNGSHAARSFVATPTGTNFHTPACPMIANRSGSLRTISEAEVPSMKPCRVCEPLVSTN